MQYRTATRLLAVALGAITACSDLATETPADGDALDTALPGLTASERAAFVRGDGEFERRFAPITGLGPIFNNVSCASCHSADGRGRLSNSLQRIGTSSDDLLRAVGGPQIQDRAIPGAEAERVPNGAAVSLRLPPPVFGVGLIDAIDDSTILSHADPDDRDGDGISGRSNWVTPADYAPNAPTNAAGQRLGRFGRKAQTASLLEQTVEAYHQDMGITSDFRPRENHNPLSSVPVDAADRVADPEVPPATVLAVVHYLRTLAPPYPGADSDQRRAGRALFTTAGCASCHIRSLTTGPNAIAAVANRPVELYSDLLLHDMGDALADNRPDGGATGREWRTTPLWGLRLMRQFLNGQAFLLHDGRARTVKDAILQHGGEARRSRDAFAALTATERQALVDFVESR
ncbi:MAG TPA: di-heme oxidoredictase family protein [Gemmatimonadaceae bacterium]|nr:di-heme oxidoredictase family protein [Gemmatimonadaceae bacterium]